MKEKPRLSATELKSLDVSFCYQMGKRARQRGEPKEDNPWVFGTEFRKYWDIGWQDEHDIIVIV